MSRKLKSLPFDDRNQQDFEIITQNIIGALELIEQNPKIPATQNKLAELAKCSRKTLHNRKYPIKALKDIKKTRNTKKTESSPKDINIDEYDNSENNSLLIKNYQIQNGQLFDQVQNLQEEVTILRNTNDIYEEDIKTLKEDNNRLNLELTTLKEKYESKPIAKVIKIVR